MQSVHTPCRPPQAAETTLNNNLTSNIQTATKIEKINYNDEIIRVTPLEYAGFFKYLSNKTNRYDIKVDIVEFALSEFATA